MVNVLSLFDGMGCGYQAFKDANIPVENYHACEIDKYAMQIAMKNHPDTIQFGDVCKFKPTIHYDYVIGGSPCQGFSQAGKQGGFKDDRSILFWEFVIILSECKIINPNVKFLLENVKMSKLNQDIISSILSVEPVLINSSLLSAQNRKRLYWCNWDVRQPEDSGVTWGDVREHGVNSDCYYYTDKALQWLGKHSNKNNKQLKIHLDSEKMQMLEASHHEKYSSQRFFGIVDKPEQSVASMRGRKIDPLTLCRVDENKEIKPIQHIEFKYDQKSNCLSTVGKDNIIVPFTLTNRIPVDEFFFRYITPIECERLQTLPDRYTEGVSNTQRYRMIGNGWTVAVIEHILRESLCTNQPSKS